MLSREIRDLAHVPRWSIIRKIRTQSVAEHCYYTAMYAIETADRIGWSIINRENKAVLIEYALWHDAEEAFMSDMPGPIKRAISEPTRYEEYAEEQSQRRWRKSSGEILTKTVGREETADDIKKIVRFASTLDEFFYLLDEKGLGNSTLSDVITISHNKVLKEFDALPFVCDKEQTVHFLSDIMENNHNGRSKNFDGMELKRQTV